MQSFQRFMIHADLAPLVLTAIDFFGVALFPQTSPRCVRKIWLVLDPGKWVITNQSAPDRPSIAVSLNTTHTFFH